MTWWSTLLLLCSATLFDLRTVHADCIWYGWRAVNDSARPGFSCSYEGPARPLSDSTGVGIIRQWCPHLAQGSPIQTCCDSEQLGVLDNALKGIHGAFGHCPACFKNIRNLFCELTCSPRMNEFLHVRNTTELKGKKVVTAVDCSLSSAFAEGLYTSCKSVANIQYATLNEFDYLYASPRDVKTLFDRFGTLMATMLLPTNFIITDSSSMKPVNMMSYKCSENVTATGEDPAGACSILDCDSIPAFDPQPYDDCSAPCLTDLQKKYLDETVGSAYTVVQIFVQPSNLSFVPAVPSMPSVSGAFMGKQDLHYTPIGLWGPVFNLSFLHAALKLQDAIANVTVLNASNSIHLKDVCMRSASADGSHCLILSALQYFQNSHSQLEKLRTEKVFFDDVSDHLSHCFRYPELFDKDMNMPCVGDSGPVMPYLVFAHYTEPAYYNASTLVISFLLKNPTNESDQRSVTAWNDDLSRFLRGYRDPLFKLTYHSWTFPGKITAPSGSIIPVRTNTISGVVSVVVVTAMGVAAAIVAFVYKWRRTRQNPYRHMQSNENPY